MTCRKPSEALYIGQLSNNYPDLLPEMSKYCCPVEIFILEIRPTFKAACQDRQRRGKCRKSVFPKDKQNGASGF